MEQIQKIIAIGIIGTASSLILKKEAPVFSVLSSVVTGILIFGTVFSSFETVISSLKSIFVRTNFDSGIVNTVFKICAIGILSEYFCNIVEDSGETAIAKKMEFASKIIIFTFTLPLIAEIIESIWSII